MLPTELRALLGEGIPDALGLLARPYPRAQLLELVVGFLALHPTDS